MVIEALEPYRKRIEEIAVESTFNWYWPVDGLMDQGYKVKLANPAAMEPYEGHDESDARFLAELLPLQGIAGSAFPKAGHDQWQNPGGRRDGLF